jgi:extracellular elastinolytic metalloproteinase
MPSDVDRRGPDEYVRVKLGPEDLPLLARDPEGSAIEKARLVAELTTEILGAEESQPIEFFTDPQPQISSAGATTVHLQQQFESIPVFQTAQIVRFGVHGDTKLSQATLVSVSEVPAVSPSISAVSATTAAIDHVLAAAQEEAESNGVRDLPVGDFELTVVAEFAQLPARPTLLHSDQFEDPSKASLVWFPLGRRLRLAWEIEVAISPEVGAFLVVMDAADSTVLFSAPLVFGVVTARVFEVDPRQERQVVTLPVPWAAYDLPVDRKLPASPPDWAETETGATTRGYSVDALTNPGSQRATAAGGLHFDEPEPLSQGQQLVNAFYGACSVHDVLYLLGFREADGSFQDVDDDRSRPTRRLKVEVCAGPIFGTAHWWPLGRVPTLRLGPRKETGRHSALDMTLICHEYMHGVSTRLVGGGSQPNPLTGAQSRGMGEGWGDYVACTLTGRAVIGSWVTDDDLGMRRFPYDAAFPVTQANLGILATLGTYEIGELWCATLMETTRRVGRALGLQLMLDALKGLPANPTLLDGRDAILAAADDLREAAELSDEDHSRVRASIWGAFALFGMGLNAQVVGPQVSGAVADETVPAE